MPVLLDENNYNSRSGTELMMLKLDQMLKERNPELYDEVLITRDLNKLRATDKLSIYWAHNFPGDPIIPGNERATLSNRETRWNDIDFIVFVSEWQRQEFIKAYGFSDEDLKHTLVLRNAIEPIEKHDKPTDVIRLIYTSVPLRGLSLLYSAFNDISPEYDNVELDVYSSFNVYGRPDLDARYERLFDSLQTHPKINYYGTVSNTEIKDALKCSHIFAYPSTFKETSCISLIEAMSANLWCVHSDIGGLAETAGNQTMMYPYVTEPRHTEVFKEQLRHAIDLASKQKLPQGQKEYTDYRYSWDNRYIEWVLFLKQNI